MNDNLDDYVSPDDYVPPDEHAQTIPVCSPIGQALWAAHTLACDADDEAVRDGRPRWLWLQDTIRDLVSIPTAPDYPCPVHGTRGHREPDGCPYL